MSTPVIPAGSMIVATVLQAGQQSGGIGARHLHADGPLGANFFIREIVQRLPALFDEACLPETLPRGGALTFLLQVFLPDGQLLSFHASAPIEQPTPRAAVLGAWTMNFPSFLDRVGGVVRHTQAGTVSSASRGERRQVH